MTNLALKEKVRCSLEDAKEGIFEFAYLLVDEMGETCKVKRIYNNMVLPEIIDVVSEDVILPEKAKNIALQYHHTIANKINQKCNNLANIELVFKPNLKEHMALFDDFFKEKQIWRKKGPGGWIRIRHIMEKGYPHYDGGAEGAVVEFLPSQERSARFLDPKIKSGFYAGNWREDIAAYRFPLGCENELVDQNAILKVDKVYLWQKSSEPQDSTIKQVDVSSLI